MSDDPQEPVEQSDDLVRVKRAYAIACVNLADMNDTLALARDMCTKMTSALDGAMVLINQLLMEMRNKGVEPSPQIIAFKAGFDKGMRELLGPKPSGD